MANKSVFSSAPAGKIPPAADAVNRAGGVAYEMGPKAALAQYASTGTFNDTFYSTAEAQVSEVLAILAKIDDVEYIGKVALYARTDGRMKDMPALICAHLTTRGDAGLSVFRRVFPVVIDNGKMLRNFFQIIRSGAVGRKSFGTGPRKAIVKWFSNRKPEDIFKMSVGNDPTLGDVINLIRIPDLDSPERKALYKYLIGHDDYDAESLPPLVKEYELLKKDPSKVSVLPKVPMEMLMGLPLTAEQWKLLAAQMTWNQLRMNINTLARRGVFKDARMVNMVAEKLANRELIEKANPFPYQLFTSYIFTKNSTGEDSVPPKILNALHDALEIATKNVPTFNGQVYIPVDTSGSMSSAVTGSRKGSTSKMNCIDVASLISCAFLKKNRESILLPFDTRLHMAHGINPNDSIMTNADKLRKFGGGGTSVSLPMAYLNQTKAMGELVVYVSDNESWYDVNKDNHFWGIPTSTSLAKEWSIYKARNPKAKLVCIDLAQNSTVQAKTDADALNIGGFSDSIWEIIKKFVEGVPSADYWVDTINKIQLPEALQK